MKIAIVANDPAQGINFLPPDAMIIHSRLQAEWRDHRFWILLKDSNVAGLEFDDFVLLGGDRRVRSEVKLLTRHPMRRVAILAQNIASVVVPDEAEIMIPSRVFAHGGCRYQIFRPGDERLMHVEEFDSYQVHGSASLVGLREIAADKTRATK